MHNQSGQAGATCEETKTSNETNETSDRGCKQFEEREGGEFSDRPAASRRRLLTGPSRLVTRPDRISAAMDIDLDEYHPDTRPIEIKIEPAGGVQYSAIAALRITRDDGSDTLSKDGKQRYLKQFNKEFDASLLGRERRSIESIAHYAAKSRTPHSLLEQLTVNRYINAEQKRAAAYLIGPLSDFERSLRAHDSELRRQSNPPRSTKRRLPRRIVRKNRLRNEMREQQREAELQHKAKRAENAQRSRDYQRKLVRVYFNVHPCIHCSSC